MREIRTTVQRNAVLGVPYGMTPAGKVFPVTEWARANLLWAPFPSALDDIEGMVFHRLLIDQIEGVFEDLEAEELWHYFHVWSGSYAVRRVRARQSISSHAWACAVDFNAPEKPLGSDRPWPAEVVGVWNAHGFINGEKWQRKDCMHFQAVKVFP